MSETPQGKVPGTYKAFIGRFPKLGEAHDLGDAAAGEGPLDRKTCLLIKVGVCVGAGLESAVKANVRKATQAGATEAEVEQAIVQAYNSLGLPRTVAAWSWAREQMGRDG